MKTRWYSPAQAKRDLAAIDEMYEKGDAKIMTPAIRDALKKKIYSRLAAMTRRGSK